MSRTSFRPLCPGLLPLVCSHFCPGTTAQAPASPLSGPWAHTALPSRLAHSRTNPQVLDTGLTAQDIRYAECHSPVDWDKPDGRGAEQDDLFSF